MDSLHESRCSRAPSITVILCTYNRCRILAKALQSIASSILSDRIDWEVLVVDNNSSDQTSETIAQFCHQYPRRFRYLLEPKAGKSYALNSGIRVARGEILAFVDDDVTVEPTWLDNLTSSLRDGAWAGSGGRTLPSQTVPVPLWLSLEGRYGLGGIVAAWFDMGNESCELDRAPYGTNMAFRKIMFEKYGGFRTDLGPSPDKSVLRPNEDTEFGRRLMSAGEHLRYEPSAIVYHPVSESRLTKEYILDWSFDYGRASTRESGGRPDIIGIPRGCFTIPKVALTMLAPQAVRWMFALNPKRRFYYKSRVWMDAGRIREVVHRWGSAKSRGIG